MNAIAPDGSVMQLLGTERWHIIKAYRDTCDDPATASDKIPRKVRDKLRITTEIYVEGTREEDWKDAVEKGALRLYRKHLPIMKRYMGESLSTEPDSITPVAAALLHADDFTDKHYRGNSKKTENDIVEMLQTYCAMLPYQPMRTFTLDYMERFFKERRASKRVRSWMYRFWQYLLDADIVAGDVNPCPKQAKKKLSLETLQARAMISDRLSMQMQDDLFAYLLKHFSGAACGVALMIWAGIADCRYLCWGDVVFDNKDFYLCRIKLRRDELAGYTHDYTRVVFPQAAMILRMWYHKLRQRYSEEQLAKMPIVALAKNPAKGMSAYGLRSFANIALRAAGIQEQCFNIYEDEEQPVSSRVLLNTYDSNLRTRCGLDDDLGTVQFQMGRSLNKNTTNDNYTSFTEPMAVDRIHTVTMAIQPAMVLPQHSDPQMIDNGMNLYTYNPPTTRDYQRLAVTVTIPPHQDCWLMAPHGLSGSITRSCSSEADSTKVTTDCAD